MRKNRKSAAGGARGERKNRKKKKKIFQNSLAHVNVFCTVHQTQHATTEGTSAYQVMV
jgi:hypothetical protein